MCLSQGWQTFEMRNIVLIYSLILSLSNYSFSQERYIWNDIQKTELFSFSKNDYCENIKSTELTSNIAIECDKNEWKNYLLHLKEPEFDVLIEKECLILRVFFSKSKSDFIIYRKQGILMDLNHPEILLQIDNVTEFDELIKKSIN